MDGQKNEVKQCWKLISCHWQMRQKIVNWTRFSMRLQVKIAFYSFFSQKCDVNSNQNFPSHTQTHKTNGSLFWKFCIFLINWFELTGWQISGIIFHIIMHLIAQEELSVEQAKFKWMNNFHAMPLLRNMFEMYLFLQMFPYSDPFD